MIRNDKNIIIDRAVVKLELLDREKRLNYIRKLQANLKGLMIMECIVCNNCLTLVNPLSETVPVNVRELTIGSRLFKFLEPQCPVCGSFIDCETFFHIEN
jgi:hypothetical protein